MKDFGGFRDCWGQTAARLKEEAEAYRERIAAQAEGDAQRFSSLLAEYKKAPQVTRDRLYTEAMQEVYTNVTKVLVDSRNGSNLLYLPLDKIMQSAGAAPLAADAAGTRAPVASSNGAAAVPANPIDVRVRDSRSRERDSR